MKKLATQAGSTKSNFGLVPSAEPSHNKLSGAATQWSTGAGSEFDELTGKLDNVAGEYTATEAENTREAGRVNR